MYDTYTSEHLSQKLSRPLIHFIWFLWETHRGPEASEFHITLQSGGADGQRFVIPSAGVTVTKDFACDIDADIVIRKLDGRYLMG